MIINGTSWMPGICASDFEMRQNANDKSRFSEPLDALMIFECFQLP
jgi:hypothetical protein